MEQKKKLEQALKELWIVTFSIDKIRDFIFDLLNIQVAYNSEGFEEIYLVERNVKI